VKITAPRSGQRGAKARRAQSHRGGRFPPGSPAADTLDSVAERFTAKLEDRYVIVPLDVRALWGEARPPVAGTVNGVPFRTRLAVYGGQTVLGLTNAIRAQAGVHAGDEVEVVIDRDDAPREVEVPPALQAALDGDPQARAAFDRLSFTHRREYATWVAEAKREDTRARRVAQTLERLKP
jgi:hypothetical protein